jgi:hypothetical protein
MRPDGFSKFCKVVISFQGAKYATEVRANNANWSKLGVIVNIFVKGHKIGAA